MTYTQAFMKNFLGASPDWYKLTIIAFLVINPILFFSSAHLLLAGYSLLSLFSPSHGIKMLPSSTRWFISI